MILVMVVVAAIGAGLAFVLSNGNGAASGSTLTLRVPSPSMLPTLGVGSHVKVVLNRAYVPQVGDIVVFHPPAGADPATPVCGTPNQGEGHGQACDAPTPRESSEEFIKRVVAGPGDTFRMINGHAYRNGVRELDGYIQPCGTDPSCNFRTPITIPHGEYFVLGDNRGASDDSRFWGPVPIAFIVGRVQR